MAFPWLPKFMRRMLGRRIGRRFRAFVPMLGITEETMPATEWALSARPRIRLTRRDNRFVIKIPDET